MSDQKLPNYLKLPTGRVMPFSMEQWRKPDTLPCDKSGQVVGGFKKPVIGMKRRQRPDELPESEVTPPPADTRPARVAPAENISAEQQEKNEQEKAKLIDFAKKRFNVDLDPADSLEVIKARLKTMASSATGAAPEPEATGKKSRKKGAK